MRYHYLEIEDAGQQFSFSQHPWFSPQKELGSIPSSIFEKFVWSWYHLVLICSGDLPTAT